MSQNDLKKAKHDNDSVENRLQNSTDSLDSAQNKLHSLQLSVRDTILQHSILCIQDFKKIQTKH